jgi:hypothetical protein
MNKSVIVLLSFAILFAYTTTASVYAQNQDQQDPTQNQTSGQGQNQTSAAITGAPQTFAVNQTTVPAQQTSVQINQTTKPIEGQGQIQPLENQTLQQQTPNLSGLKNQTMVQATGPAITTIVNKTTVPFNQTSVETGNMTGSVQQQNQSAQQGQGQGQQASQQQNQSAQQGQGQGQQASQQQNQSAQQGQANPVGGSNQQQQQPQQQNQSKGPLEQLGESVGNLVGGGNK